MFDFGPRVNGQYSTFNSDNWVVMSSKELPEKTFASEMEDFLDGLELDSNDEYPTGIANIEYTSNMRDKLMSILKEAEDLEMGGRCAIS